MPRDCPGFSCLKMGFAGGKCPRRRSAADLDVSAKRTGLCHPFRVEVCLFGLPGVSRRGAPGYSDGIPPGCTVTERQVIPESQCSFVLHDIDGKSFKRKECQKFRSGTVVEFLGTVGSGILLGTLILRDEVAGTPAGVRVARGSVTGGIATLNHRLPAGKGRLRPPPNAPPAKKRRHGNSVNILTYMKTIPCRRATECAQDTGNEMVRCVSKAIIRPVPETDAVFGPARMARRGSTRPPRHRVVPPTVFGCGARRNSFVPDGTRYVGSNNPPLKTVGYCRSSQRDFSLSARSGADISRLSMGRRQGIPETWCRFVLHSVDGEWVMPHDCPEFSCLKMGFADGKCPRRRSAADLDVSAKRTGLCHPFRVGVCLFGLPGVSRRGTPGYSDGIPPGCTVTERQEIPESRCSFILHGLDDEWVMPYDCPELCPTDSGATTPGCECAWERVRHACCAFTGLTGHFGGPTWACARRTRSSPGYHIGGFQPRRGSAGSCPSRRRDARATRMGPEGGGNYLADRVGLARGGE